ncbi:hypothetical protein, partial [Selenomonas ruminantium]|uniref:hypothetical protein n=1 Tax=Selenomonas ruminantium TaxID=971 RepID=UPI001C49E865
KFLQTSGLIMLHDYFALFSFQRTILQSISFEVPVASSDSFILPPSDQLVKNFLKFFRSFLEAFQRPANQGLLGCFISVSVSDLYYITRVLSICQHLF